MNIGEMLKRWREDARLTQEDVAHSLNVSRQTISNWENERSYPDLIYTIQLSDLYGVSLDVLIKGDEKMIEHLEKSTNIVASNKRLLLAIAVNIVIVIGMFFILNVIGHNIIFILTGFTLLIISTTLIMFEIINKL